MSASTVGGEPLGAQHRRPTEPADLDTLLDPRVAQRLESLLARIRTNAVLFDEAAAAYEAGAVDAIAAVRDLVVERSPD